MVIETKKLRFVVQAEQTVIFVLTVQVSCVINDVTPFNELNMQSLMT
jgi:hypothetical protein